MANAIRAAVFDIDGTLAMMDKSKSSYAALPGAVEALAACRQAGMPVVAYTNGTFFPPSHYYPLLSDAGLVVDPGHILTPAVVAAKVLRKTGYRRILVLGADGTKVPLREAGLDVVEPEAGFGKIDAVMLGWSKNFQGSEVEAVCHAAWDGAPVYAASVAPYFASANGRMIGVSGAVAAMVEYTTGVKATVLGKPSVAGLDMIADLTGVPSAAMAVIGDDPKLEISMARAGGAMAIGVTTGLVDRAGFESQPEAVRAHHVLDSLEGLFDQPWLRQGAR